MSHKYFAALRRSFRYRDKYGRKNPYFKRRVASLVVVLVGFVAVVWLAILILGFIFGAIGSLLSGGNQEGVPVEEPQVEVWTPPIPDFTIACGDSAQSLVGTVKLGVVAECGSQEAYSMASLAKTITALVVTDHITDPASYAQTFTVDDEAILDERNALDEGGTVLDVSWGEDITKRELLEGSMLYSANNVADMLARSEFGTLENYKAAARQYLDNHGLNNIQLGNDASGLDNLTKATPRDLFKLAKLALDNPVVAEVVNMQSTIFPTSRGSEGIWNVIGDLLRLGFTGIKSGYTHEAGRCLIYSYPVPNSDDVIIGVDLGDKNDDNGFSFLAAQEHASTLAARLQNGV